jgi:hypothetical protein
MVPPNLCSPSACSCWWRSVDCHFWPRDLSANQQRYEQRCSKQATADHSEKTNVGFVVCHFPLLHNNYAGMKAFPSSGLRRLAVSNLAVVPVLCGILSPSHRSVPRGKRRPSGSRVQRISTSYPSFRSRTDVGPRFSRAGLCNNHELCTKSLTHIKCAFMLCILYVRNGERYDGLRIRAG